MNRRSQASRTAPVLIGLTLMVVSTAIFYKENHAVATAGNQTYHPGSDWMIACTPMLLLCGTVILVRGAIWKAKAFSPRSILTCGLVMLAFGGYPWVYTGDGEGGGMMGTLLFISLGIPGILVTIIGFSLGGGQRES